jgi:HlyD family secretion protein
MHPNPRRIVPVIVLVVAIAAGAIWYLNQPSDAAGATTGSGTIEATSVTLAPEIAGRVAEVLVDEGDAVKKGDVLVRLDGTTLEAQRGQAAAALDAAEATASAADAEVALLQAGASAEQVAVAQAAVDRAKVTADALHDRYADLSKAARKTTAGKALKTQRDTAAAGLRQARAQLALVRAGARPEQIEAAQARAKAAAAQVEAAKAALAVVDSQIGKLAITAPSDGVVLARGVEPGSFAAPGSPLLEVGDLGDLSITVYVPEDRYGQLSLGQTASLSVDSFPGETFTGTIVHIADQAEFTPRNVQTEDGRRSTVFAIRLAVDDTSGKLKPGMPADVTF